MKTRVYGPYIRAKSGLADDFPINISPRTTYEHCTGAICSVPEASGSESGFKVGEKFADAENRLPSEILKKEKNISYIIILHFQSQNIIFLKNLLCN
jgi:hypothetical protein